MARRSRRYGLASGINTQHTYLIALTIIAFLLLVSGQIYKNLYDGVRGGVMAVTSPIIKIVNSPFKIAHDVSENLGDYKELQKKYENLQLDMRQASYWEAYARQLLAENQLLRERWNLAKDFPKLPGNFVVARIIADLSGTFINSFIINSGKINHINENDIALNNGSLVGRVIDTKNNYARILLLTDINSRIPVIIGPERLRAIMAGNNSDKTDVFFAPIDSVITPGMNVFTSGHGGIFPPGIPIGQIIASKSDIIKISLITNPHILEYIDILSFGAKIILEDSKTNISENYQERQN